MAAVEIVEVPRYEETPVRLRVVDPWEGRRGPSLAQRRAARARMMARRRRTLCVLALSLGLVILAWPGHAFGGTTGTGLPTDLATSAVLASGMSYVVQPGDTLSSIAAAVNPLDPAAARAALVSELGSTYVVAGEHVVIP
jgi:predicted anti-sigma-YlaC factor YlaD